MLHKSDAEAVGIRVQIVEALTSEARGNGR